MFQNTTLYFPAYMIEDQKNKNFYIQTLNVTQIVLDVAIFFEEIGVTFIEVGVVLECFSNTNTPSDIKI